MAEDFDAVHRGALVGLTECLHTTTNRALCNLHVHSLWAWQGVAATQAFQTQLRLKGAHPTTVLDQVLAFDKSVLDKLITVHQKQGAAAAACGVSVLVDWGNVVIGVATATEVAIVQAVQVVVGAGNWEARLVLLIDGAAPYGVLVCYLHTGMALSHVHC